MSPPLCSSSHASSLSSSRAFITTDGKLAESAVLNISFVTKDGVFLTPKFDDILAGTTVRKAMELANAAKASSQFGITGVEQTDVTLDDLKVRVFPFVYTLQWYIAHGWAYKFAAEATGNGKLRGTLKPQGVGRIDDVTGFRRVRYKQRLVWWVRGP